MNTSPLGAYAVEGISYELGVSGTLPAMAVSVSYRHSDAQIRQIRDIAYMDEAEPLVAEALKDHAPRLLLRAEMYFETDFQQMARNFAEANPEAVMEIPKVTVGVYGTGASRVVELNFAYQNSRDSLRQMRSRVKPVFDAAELYVSADAADRQKYSQLYGFLTERFDYKIETSITPAYSLLCHGVGDSRAFATVYASMCRQAGLECHTVTGTANGEPRTWNIVCDNGIYYHVDLLRCSTEGRFRGYADWEMGGYVWDYSAFPACGGVAEEFPEEITEESVAEE
jgi:hypothetical protein